jgi:hypothetical protein
MTLRVKAISLMAVAVCALTLPIVAVASPAGASTSHPKYISALHRLAPGTRSVSTKKLLALGEATCNIFKFAPVSEEVGVLDEPSNAFHFPITR